MKKLWNLMLVALVIMGAAACTETDESVDAKQEAGLSFYAEIVNDDTRAYIDDADGDKTWETIWESGDELIVEANGVFYTFAYDGEKFTCEADGVTDLVGQTVTVSSKHEYRDSKAGKKGWSINETQVENFADGSTVKLNANTSFFRYTYNGDGAVTFTVKVAGENPPLVFLDGNLNFSESVIISGVKDENFIPFWTQNLTAIEATLSYSIDGVKCKETTLQLAPGKIYNLGTLTDPAPEYEVSETWGIAGNFNGWAAGTPEPMYVVDDMLVAFNLTNLDGGFKFVQNKDWEGAKGSQSTTAVASGEWLNCGDNDIVTVDAAAYDVYFSTERSMYCLVPAGGDAPAIPEKQAIVWSLAGSYNDWSENLMTATDTPNLFVVKGVELASGDEIKVKDSTTWDTSYGGGITNLNANSWMKAYFNGSNIVVAKSGAYDVYFEYAEGAEYSKLYLVEADVDYTTAVEQTENGTLIPDEGTEMPTDLVLGIAGSFQGWDVATAIPMVVADGWYIASGVELYKDDEFKIVKDNAWTVSYGGNGAVLVAETGTEYTLVSDNSKNIAPTKNGKFNIYFNPLTLAFKYECVEEYTDLTVNITIDNKANWSPLYITLKSGDTTIVDNTSVTDNKYAISGDYIGETLSYVLSNGSKTSEGNVTITKDGATINLEETIIKLTVQLNTDNSKQWWGSTMKIHVWSTGTSFDTSWPGVAMTSEGNYTWSINVPSELVGKTINYLVHNGNGWQSSDAKVTIKAEGNTITGSSIGIN